MHFQPRHFLIGIFAGVVLLGLFALVDFDLASAFIVFFLASFGLIFLSKLGVQLPFVVTVYALIFSSIALCFLAILIVSLFGPILVFLVTVGLVVAVGIRYQAQTLARRRLNSGLCPVCGYDLRKSIEGCPECGAEIPEELARRRRIYHEMARAAGRDPIGPPPPSRPVLPPVLRNP